MADESLVRALAECLDALRDGGGAITACLAKYPDRRQELEELLSLVELIPTLPRHVRPDPAFVDRTRDWLASRPPGPSSPGSDPAIA